MAMAPPVPWPHPATSLRCSAPSARAAVHRLHARRPRRRICTGPSRGLVRLRAGPAAAAAHPQCRPTEERRASSASAGGRDEGRDRWQQEAHRGRELHSYGLQCRRTGRALQVRQHHAALALQTVKPVAVAPAAAAVAGGRVGVLDLHEEGRLQLTARGRRRSKLPTAPRSLTCSATVWPRRPSFPPCGRRRSELPTAPDR
jgi:hypothetical protein